MGEAADSDQRLPCSVVLEGGVTSAVIYASLLAELSGRFSFRQLGGASSGALAAAAAAAAEYRRGRSSAAADDTFAQLARYPALLADRDPQGRTKLFNFFQPSRAGRGGFAVATALLGRERRPGWRGKSADLLHAIGLTARHFPWGGLLAALVCIGITAFVARALVDSPVCSGGPLVQSGCAVAGLVLWLLAAATPAVLILALWALLATARALRTNHWGLCSGMGATDAEALTPSLHRLLQGLAGKAEREPLTFADLWGPAAADDPQRARRRIDLQVITTAISLGRPLRLPGDAAADPLQEFFYDPDEWRGLFPAAVIDHLAAHARPVTLQHDDGRVLRALPAPGQWPVVMAARFSLSFPMLLSAMPMYIAVLRRGMIRAGDRARQLPFEARKVYFSDGGITSNCPVHLFDAPLPAFPTFGVNLYRPRKGRRVRVSRSDTHDPELEAAATPDPATWRGPLPFLLSLVSTMLDWRDSLQRRLPGYRERIVHVAVPSQAGGLNLAMAPGTILRLGRLGKLAAARLVRDFSTPPRPGESSAWERHRWIRTRTTLSALRAYLSAFERRLEAGSPDYLQLLRSTTPPGSPFEDEAARQQALGLALGLRELMQRIDAAAPADALDRNSPRPRPDLHMSPPW